MRGRLKLIAIGGIAVLGCAVSCSDLSSPQTQIERGRYLVERVAMCGDCHTPMTASGEPDRAHWWQGSQLDFVPRHPIPNWVDAAPAIAGLPGYTVEQAATILETGIAPGGRHLRPPMPQFRMSHEDAMAVAAYLKSLGQRDQQKR